MIRHTALSLSLALVACAPAAPDLRSAGAQISSKAVVDLGQLSGDWQVVASYDPAVWPVASTVTLDLDRASGATAVNGATVWTVANSGPGRWTLQRGTHTTEIWLLWADDTYRTAVFGNPAGSVGLILNRNPSIPADRLSAAREMLAFNGYDLAGLTVAP